MTSDVCKVARNSSKGHASFTVGKNEYTEVEVDCNNQEFIDNIPFKIEDVLRSESKSSSIVYNDLLFVNVSRKEIRTCDILQVFNHQDSSYRLKLIVAASDDWNEVGKKKQSAENFYTSYAYGLMRNLKIVGGN